MRGLIGAGLALLWLSCSTAPPFASRRLSYGTYELTCKLPLAQCLDHVDEICNRKGYVVVSAHDRRSAIDVEIAVQNEVRTSDAVIRCDVGKPLFGAGPEPPAPADGGAMTEPARPPASWACVPGATQVCVGRGACSGGQACLADGSGFGPCACGPAGRAADGGTD